MKVQARNLKEHFPAAHMVLFIVMYGTHIRSQNVGIRSNYYYYYYYYYYY